MRSAARLVLVCVLVLVACSCGKKKDTKSSATVDASRPGPDQAERQRSVAAIAPAYGAEPLAGPDGVDAYGLPLKYVNRAAVRAMLFAKMFAELTAFFNKVQDDFEADQARESWVIDVGDAFDSAEPELNPSLHAWVAASPDSFAPYYARGVYEKAVGFAKRGGRWAKDTKPEDFAAMNESLKLSEADLDKALTLRPKLVAAMRKKLSSGRSTPTLLARALKECPGCFRMRVAHMLNLAPRWGGTYEAMAAFAKASIQESPAPAMKLLAGFVDYDRATLLGAKPDEALVPIDRACALGEYWLFLQERADIQRTRKDFARARADIDRAAALRPMDPGILTSRAYVSTYEKKYEPAAIDARDVLRMEPTNGGVRGMVNNLIDGLAYEAWQHQTAGRTKDALRVYELGLELAPGDARLRPRYNALLVGDAGSAEGIAALEDEVRRSPDDFALLQRLDYALATQRNFDRVIELWTAYIARHPDDGRAYLERGGAYTQLRKMKEAYADAKDACAHGSSQGCDRAKRIAPMAQ